MKNKITLSALIVSFVIVQIWFSYVTFNHPNSDIKVEQDNKDEWIVTEFEKSNTVSTLDLKVGDIVSEINNNKAEDYFTVKKWHEIEQADNITVVRNGEEHQVITKKEIKNFLLFYLNPIIGELVSLSIGILLLFKMRNSKSALLLSFVFFSISIVFMSFGASIRGDILGKIFISNFMMLIPTTLLHFLIVFFKEKGDIHLRHKYLKYLYGSILLAFVSNLFYFMPYDTYAIYTYSRYFTTLYFLVAFIFNVCILSYIFVKFRNKNPYLSIIIRTIWVSILISFVPILFLSLVPQIIFQLELVNPLYTGWFVLFFPISFAYLIISKQLYDINIVLRRVLYTTTISIVPSGIIMILNALIFQKDATIVHLSISFIIILFVLSFIFYSLEYFATKLEVVMFPRKYHLQSALKKISKDIGTITNFRELKEIILVDIVNTLQVYGGAIIIRLPYEIEMINQGSIDLKEVERLLILNDWKKSEYTCLPINSHEEYEMYLVMTKKKTNVYLNREEIQWLNLIISYLAASLENVYLIRKLNMKLHELASNIPNEAGSQDILWFRKSMFEIQERERIRISMDLHDSTMQDIFFVQRKLRTLDKLLNGTEEHKQMTGVLSHLDLINENLRHCCFELNPHLLKNVGLLATLQNLIDIESGMVSYDLNFNVEGITPTNESMDFEMKQHIFRIIQELINNAKKHSQASCLDIKLKANDELFYILYEDDGVGFQESKDSNTEIFQKSGIGIEQMKSRIIHLNGQFSLKSSLGKGVKIHIEIPMKGELIA